MLGIFRFSTGQIRLLTGFLSLCWGVEQLKALPLSEVSSTDTVFTDSVHRDTSDQTAFYRTNHLSDDWTAWLEEQSENGVDIEGWAERLDELANEPIDLHSATRETLESIPFLSAEQVENLSYYLYRYGPMKTLSELLLVEGMDELSLQRLLPFVRIGMTGPNRVERPSLRKALQFGRQEIRITGGRSWLKENNDATMAGDAFRSQFRYGFDYKKKLQAGWLMEKDPGEAWWHRGPDFWSFHLLLKQVGRINTLILGDYQLRFGQGLVCGSPFSLGKSIVGASPEQVGTTVSRHFSSSESAFFRGAAATLMLQEFRPEAGNLSGIELTVFASRRRKDALVCQDSFTVIDQTGLHRTSDEIEKKGRLGEFTGGYHLRFRRRSAQWGMTTLGWVWDAVQHPGTTPREFVEESRTGGINFSTDLRVRLGRFLMFGEAAMDQRGRTAWLSGCSVKPWQGANLHLLARSYDKAYSAPFAHAFSDGTQPVNEQGFFVRMDFDLFRRCRAYLGFDLLRFPWLKSGVDAPSVGQDLYLQLTGMSGRSGHWELRFNEKRREVNGDEVVGHTHVLIDETRRQGRASYRHLGKIWSVRTQCLANMVCGNGDEGWGWALVQDIQWKDKDGVATADLHVAYYSTDTWKNRFYIWEKALPGRFSMPMLYGQGVRTALCASWNTPLVEIRLGLGHTGRWADETPEQTKTIIRSMDVQLQLRRRF